MRLTKRTVEALKPDPERQTFVYDDEIPGLGVRINPTGSKAYILQYRNKYARSRRYTLGKHGAITAEQARRLAREALAAVAEGRDPQAERQADRKQPTVRELADRYIKDHAEPYKKPSSLRNDRAKLDNHILPKLGARAVADVRAEDVGKLVQSLSDRPAQANHVLALLSKMFNLAEEWGLRPQNTNPTQHIRRYRLEGRERYLSGEELRRIGQALRSLEGKRKIEPQAARAFRLLLLTGARANEILSLRWEYVDLERGELRLPVSKTGKKVVTLSRAAQDVLRRASRDSEWVIPSPKIDGHWKELRAPWERIKKEVTDLQEREIVGKMLDVKDRVDLSDVRLHDLRHTYASVAAGQGIGLQLVGKLLGHAQTSTTERYAHLADNPVRQAAERVGAEIAAALEGQEGGDVVELGPGGDR